MGYAICFCLYFFHDMTKQFQTARNIVQRTRSTQADKQFFPGWKSVKGQTRVHESHGAHFMGDIQFDHLYIRHITMKPLL